jgi:hypothetical protein
MTTTCGPSGARSCPCRTRRGLLDLARGLAGAAWLLVSTGNSAGDAA